MSIMQIGELSAGLSDEFKDATRDRMPWGLMKGIRNRFAHAYGAMEKATFGKQRPRIFQIC
jgi:uncharacterized protein with HEPN domain